MIAYSKSIKGKLYYYFKQRLSTKQSTKGFMRTDCIFCGGKFTLGINTEKNMVHCFKLCRPATTCMQLLMEVEKFETYQQAKAFLQIQQEYEAYDGGTPDKIVEQKQVVLPESFTLITQGQSIYGRSARGYLKGRGFDLIKLAMAGVGYCTDGDYEGYIIFPFIKKGKVVFFQGRRYLGNGPKMKNPDYEAFGIGKSKLIYNEDALFMYNTIYGVESITNSLTLGDNSVGFLGKKLSPYQLSRIISSPCKRAIIVLDDDAIKEAYELAMDIVNYKKTKVVKMPFEQDVNDIGRIQTIRLARATEWGRYQDFNKAKLNLKNA